MLDNKRSCRDIDAQNEFCCYSLLAPRDVLLIEDISRFECTIFERFKVLIFLFQVLNQQIISTTVSKLNLLTLSNVV